MFLYYLYNTILRSNTRKNVESILEKFEQTEVVKYNCYSKRASG